MASTQSTMDYILDQLASLKNIRSRKMFGEYALYCEEKVVALVCDDELFVKITKEGKKLLGKNCEQGFAYKGVKASLHINPDLLEDREFLCRLINITARALPEPRPKKNKL